MRAKTSLPHCLMPGRPKAMLRYSLLLLLAACGGGNQVAEITGSGSRQGDLEAFGSVFVAGERFSVDEARIELDGVIVGEEQLQVGMQAGLELRPNADRIIDRLTITSKLVGRVDQLDINNRVLRLLGQDVQLDDRTVLADAAGLRAGQVVRIFATELEDGKLLAGLVETVASNSERIAGAVSAVSGSNLTIGDLSIDVSQANAPVLRVGERIVASGQRASVSRFVASEVSRLPTLPFTRGDRVVLSGAVSNYTLAGDGSTVEFTIDGTPLRHSDGSDTIINRSALGLRNGDRVIVDGVADNDGQLVLARTITVISPVVAEVETTITGINPAEQSITVFGNISAGLGVQSQFVRRVFVGTQSYNFDSLRVGDRIELRLALVNQLVDRSRRLRDAELEIARVSSLPGNDNELIVAPLEQADESARQVTVLGQVVTINDSTQFDSHSSEADFFANVSPGDELEVELSNVGGQLTALEISVDSSELDHDSQLD